jgi:hypothetical protein
MVQNALAMIRPSTGEVFAIDNRDEKGRLTSLGRFKPVLGQVGGWYQNGRNAIFKDDDGKWWWQQIPAGSK